MYRNPSILAQPIFESKDFWFNLGLALCFGLFCIFLAVVGIVAFNRWMDRRAEAKRSRADQDAT